MSVTSCFDLRGKSALITGAAGLLGPQHAEALLSAGCRVILTDVNEDSLKAAVCRLRETYGETHVQGCVMDVTIEEQVKNVCDKVTHEFDVSILVNNAAIDPKVKEGGSGALSRLENFSLSDWTGQIAVGLTGAFIVSKFFGMRMCENNGGAILNIASDLSVIAPDQRLYQKDGIEEDQQPVKPVTYSVIKSGLIGLTRYLASYWAKEGVRVNALSPGGVFNGQPDTFVKRLADLIPMGRMAEVDEYQAAVLFLCSDASRYMTGQNIVIDGGRSVL